MAYGLRQLFPRVEAALDSNPRLRLSALARSLCVERHTIERAVRQRSGITFRQLQTQVTLKKGLEFLLSEPSRSIKEISLMLGYKSAHAFSHFMKNACGTSPLAIRKGGAAGPPQAGF